MSEVKKDLKVLLNIFNNYLKVIGCDVAKISVGDFHDNRGGSIVKMVFVGVLLFQLRSTYYVVLRN